jgi:hypothetical protein
VTARDYMPGVPAAGHVTSSGYWHPGPADGCDRCGGGRPLCDQCGTARATVYAMGPGAGDWGGYYCEPCQRRLGFVVTDRLP